MTRALTPEESAALVSVAWVAHASGGNAGTIRLAAQLFGIEPCDRCDRYKKHCQCHARGGEGD